MRAKVFALFTLAGLSVALTPAVDLLTARADTRADTIRRSVAEIESSAIAIGRRTRSPEIRIEVGDILEETQTIMRVVGPPEPPPVEPPPTRPPPTTEPPPTGPWIDPAQTGITADPHTKQVSQYGWSLCGASNFNHYQAYDNSVLNTQYQGCEGPILLVDTWVQGIPHPDGKITNKWGVRAYDLGFAETRFDHCTFSNSYTEHTFYGSALGGITWFQCKFQHAGSQGLQIVYANPNDPNRKHETRFYNAADPEGSKAAWYEFTNAHQWEPHHVIECAFIDCGIPVGIPGLHPGERPSFNGSFFGGGKNPVRIERCFMSNTLAWTDNNGVARVGIRGWMAHGRNRFELFDTYTNHPNGDADIIQVWRCGDSDPETIDVFIRGGEVWGKQHVDIRPRPGDRIVFSGVGGNSPVVISYNELYVWETMPQWDEDKVIYRGFINQDLDLTCQ